MVVFIFAFFLAKMKIVLAFSYFTIFIPLFQHGLIDSVGSKKLQKSFDEIFGDGWQMKEMGEEEGTNLAKMITKENGDQQPKMEKQPTHHPMINGKGGSTKTVADQNEEEEKNDENEQQQKREIIRKWYAIKAKIKQRVKQSKKEGIKMEIVLGKKLGSSRSTIYKWIKALGMGQMAASQLNVVSEEQKRTIIRGFLALKKQIKQQKWKLSKIDWYKIEKLLAKKFDTNRDYIYKWKRELGMGMKNKLISTKQKRTIVLAFQAIKDEIKQHKGKRSKNDWYNIEQMLAKKLGTTRDYIYRWSKEFGMGQKSAQKRMEKVRKYWKIKRNNPTISDQKIAKAMNIDVKSIRRLKKQFGEGSEDKF